MTEGTGFFDRRVAWAIGAGVAVIAAGAALTMTGGTRGPGRDGRGGSPAALAGAVGEAQGSLGVQGAAVDPARPREASRTSLTARGRDGEARDVARAVFPETPAEAPARAPTVVPRAEDVEAGEAMAAAGPEVEAAVARALAGRRAAVRSACWTGDGLPATARFVVEASYSAEGALLALSVGAGDGAPPAVSACVQGQADLAPAEVEAPGVGVTVRAPLELP